MVRFLRLWLVVAVFAIAGAPSPVPAQTAEDIQAAGVYAAQITELIQRTVRVEQVLSQFDTVIYDLADGVIGREEARASGHLAIRRIRAELANLRAEAEALPPLPTLADPTLTSQLASLRGFAETGIETIAQSLDSGVELFEAALAGDPTIFDQLEARRYDHTIEQLHAENAFLEDSRRAIPPGTPEFLLNAIVEKINDATIAALLAIRPMLAGGSLDPEGAARTHALANEARQMIASAQVTVLRLTEQVEGAAPQSVVEADNRDLVLQVLASYAQSLDVESGMVDHVETMLTVVGDNIGGDRRDELLASLASLIDQRIALSAERQRLAQGIQ
ncbi:MAG: hypothetical protein H6843_00255 [Rhodospirillaceae bacterium]|nr:hypothetical protein [Rhodospirillaceae bacterium]